MTPDEIKRRIEDDLKAHQERCDAKRALEAETAKSKLDTVERQLTLLNRIMFGTESNPGMQIRFDRVETAVNQMLASQRNLQKLIWGAILGVAVNIILMWIERGAPH